jgi:hypothetical protein
VRKRVLSRTRTENRIENGDRDVGSADNARPQCKDCSYNPIAFPPSLEVRCRR